LENGLAEEEAVGEDAQNKTGEESILPVTLGKSKIEYRS
jgi:hypothetical protein